MKVYMNILFIFNINRLQYIKDHLIRTTISTVGSLVPGRSDLIHLKALEVEFTYPTIEPSPSLSLSLSSLVIIFTSSNKKGKTIDHNRAALKKLENAFVWLSGISKKKKRALPPQKKETKDQAKKKKLFENVVEQIVGDE